jgi:hypothetical protein
VRDLPEEVREQEDERDHAAQPRPRRSQVPPGGRNEEGDENGEAEKEHGDLRQEPEAGEEAEEEPEAGLVPFQNQQQHVGGRHLEELVEGVHRDERPEHEEVGRDEDRECGEPLGEPAAP